jgi:hypothetical protein
MIKWDSWGWGGCQYSQRWEWENCRNRGIWGVGAGAPLGVLPRTTHQQRPEELGMGRSSWAFPALSSCYMGLCGALSLASVSQECREGLRGCSTFQLSPAGQRGLSFWSYLDLIQRVEIWRYISRTHSLYRQGHLSKENCGEPQAPTKPTPPCSVLVAGTCSLNPRSCGPKGGGGPQPSV